jgi:hypothetical protein
MKNMLEKKFRMWPYATKYFLFFENVSKKILKFFSEKIGYFNTGFVFYSVNIQPDIIKN